MELKQYLHIVQRWTWLLILGLVLGGNGGLLCQPLSNARLSGYYACDGHARATGKVL